MTFKPTPEQWKSIHNAEDVLKKYKKHLHHARRFPGSIGSPKFDGMPKAHGGNSIEDEIAEHIDDPNRKYCVYCQYIIKDMENESYEYAQILKMLYLGWHTPQDIKDRFHLTKNPYYDRLKEAKLIFGESCNMHKIEQWNREARRIQY